MEISTKFSGAHLSMYCLFREEYINIKTTSKQFESIHIFLCVCSHMTFQHISSNFNSPKVKQTSNQEGLDQEGFVM